jgi:hypothetical protein
MAVSIQAHGSGGGRFTVALPGVKVGVRRYSVREWSTLDGRDGSARRWDEHSQRSSLTLDDRYHSQY